MKKITCTLLMALSASIQATMLSEVIDDTHDRVFFCKRGPTAEKSTDTDVPR